MSNLISKESLPKKFVTASGVNGTFVFNYTKSELEAIESFELYKSYVDHK